MRFLIHPFARDAMFIFLTIPGLRHQDLPAMPRLRGLMEAGGCSTLQGSFPCVTWPSQATLLTGRTPQEHGVVANGFFWRERNQVEMWTAGNETIQAPQIWDRLHQGPRPRTSAAWFPMLSKRCGADYVCMPAPVHNPDGSESLWCYTQPPEYYGDLRDALGHFPLQHFWGPLANIKSTAWIVDSFAQAAARFQPEFSYVYLPHLDYAAQKNGPDSPEAAAAVGELDEQIGRLIDQVRRTPSGERAVWSAVSEYVITPVDHVLYPNRILRQAGLLRVQSTDGGEQLDVAASQAWALVDHQFSHIFVRDADPQVVRRVVELFDGAEGVARVLAGNQRAELAMDHPRSGEVILVSSPRSWQAYYFWEDDALAPAYARTVDIHRKPGYDPVELYFDPVAKGVPLDANLVRGSHGAPAESAAQRGVLLCSQAGVFPERTVVDTEVADCLVRFLQPD